MMSLRISRIRTRVMGLALLGVLSVAGVAVAEPDPLRSRPEVVEWLRRAEASPDKLGVWRKAAKEGNAFVKELVVQELVELEDERGLVILQEFVDDGVPYSPDVPNYRNNAFMAMDTMKDRLYWKANVSSKPDGPERINAARQALMSERHGVRIMAFRYLAEHDDPATLAGLALDSFEKHTDTILLDLTYDLLQQRQQEEWVVPHLKRMASITIEPIAWDMTVAPGAARETLERLDATKRWKELNANAHTPAEKKAVALKALTSGKDYHIQRWSIDYLITLDDADLIPVWVQGLTVDERIRQKVRKLGAKAVPYLIEVVADQKYPDRAGDAMSLLADIGDARAIKPIAKLMLLPLDPNGSVGAVRGSAGMALAKFGSRAVNPLVEILSSGDELAVLDAMDALNVIGDPAAIPRIKGCLAREKAKKQPSDLVIRLAERTIADLTAKKAGSKKK